MKQKPLLIFLFLALFFISGMPLQAKSELPGNFFWALFIKGSSQSNMEIKTENTEFTKSKQDTTQLVLKIPEQSSITYTFNLPQIPPQYYIVNDWQSFPKRAVAKIFVNGTELSTMSLEFNNYLSQGFEISKFLRSGQNILKIELAQNSDQLWIRGTILTDNPSLARNVDLLPAMMPAYAKTFALILLLLGLIYLVWFFFNRTLYKNMDVYSASFALIGIMVASVAAAYSFLLVSRMTATSMVILAITLLLALIAMISVKRNEAGFKKSVSTDSGSLTEESQDSGDFNF